MILTTKEEQFTIDDKDVIYILEKFNIFEVRLKERLIQVIDFAPKSPDFLETTFHHSTTKCWINKHYIDKIELIDATKGAFPHAIYSKVKLFDNKDFDYLQFHRNLATKNSSF